MIIDPRDPRIQRPEASPFDTTLNSEAAILAEMAAAIRESQRAISLLTEMQTGNSVVGSGAGGIRPTHNAIKTTAKALAEPLPSAEQIASGAPVVSARGISEGALSPLDHAAAEAILKQAASMRDRVSRGEPSRPRDTEDDPSRPVPARPPSFSDTPLSFDQGFHGLQAQTRQGVRNSIFNSVSDRLNAYGEQDNAVLPGYFPMDDGTYWEAATGNTVGPETALDADVQRRNIRRASIASVGLRGAAAFRDGRPVGRALAGSVSQGALRAAGTAAVVVTGVTKAWEFAQRQYDANRQLQGIYGGSNTDQFGERFDRWTNSIRGRLSLAGEGTYGALWNGAAQLGLRGDERDQYISSGAGLAGQGLGDSEINAIQSRVIEAGQSLFGLTEAIQSVNDAAREAGINAGRAREIFRQNYEASTSLMFGVPTNAADFASNLTVGQLSQDRRYQGINSLGTISSSSTLRTIASLNGTDYFALGSSIQQNPEAGLLLGEEELKRRLNFYTSQTTNETMEQVVARFVSSLPGGREYQPTLDQESLGNYLFSQGFDPTVIRQVLSSGGVNVSENLALGYAGNLYTSGQPGQVSTQQKAERLAELAPSPFIGSAAYDETGFFSTTSLGKLPFESGYLGKAYYRALGATKEEAVHGVLPETVRLPVIEELISRDSVGSLGLDATNTKVLVRHGNEERVVSLQDAIMYFPEQIQDGTARIVGGIDDQYLDKSVADILGFTAGQFNSTYDFNWGATEGRSSVSAQTVDEYYRERKARDKEEGGSKSSSDVQVSLTPEAQQLLQLLPSNQSATSTGVTD